MKKLLFIQDTLTNKISYFHILLFLIFLPFDRFYSELALISFAIHTVFHIKKEDLKNIFSKDVLILQSVYWLTLASAIYTTNKPEAFSILFRQSAILLFPVLLCLTTLDLNKYRVNFLCTFAITCTLTIFYLYFDAFRIIAFHHLPLPVLISPYFINQNFSLPIKLHATYLSLYAALSIIFFLTLLYKQYSVKRKIFIGICLLILLAGLIQLSSRSIVICIALFSIIFPFCHLKKIQKVKFAVIAFLLCIAVFTFIFRISSLKERFFNDLEADLTTKPAMPAIADSRAQRWEIAVALIKKSLFIGYGSGDEVDRLDKEYFANKLYNSYLNNLNAHNEYLSFLLRSGLVGLAVYLLTLSYGFTAALRNGDTVFLGFLFILAVVSLSENYLDVNKGIFFYSFFFSFFLLSKRKYQTTFS